MLDRPPQPLPQPETGPAPATRESLGTDPRPAAAVGLTPLALTMGDPAGIGAEIALGAWRSGRVRHPFFLIDDPDRVAAIARVQGGSVQVIGTPAETALVWRRALPVLAHGLGAPVTPGLPDPLNAAAVIGAIDRGVALVRAGAAAALVTNPINKRALRDGAGFAFPGHTEYLAHLGGDVPVAMLLAAPGLRVVPVTIHIALAAVPGALTHDLIIGTARLTRAALKRDFGIARPRLAMAGLNPHAGEGGAMGIEELHLIGPAIRQLQAEGMDITGPHPADTMFHPAARAQYDVALTMYHDQGLIPLKTLDFARGVNVTLGLPFIRTSPDHGTAYDIAGLGQADPTSLIEALNLAAELAHRRAEG